MADESTITIHCFPYAGGGASMYRHWQAQLPVGVQVRAYQLPGREERFDESPIGDFNELMQHLYTALLPTITPPYVLFGHSMGALVAFELAREMRRRGLAEPLHLFVSGMNAPQTKDFKPPYVHEMPDAEFVEYIKRLGGVADEFLLDPQLQKLFLPLLRQDFKAAESYRYVSGLPLSCPISAWGGADDFLTDLDNLEAWREQTTSEFRLRILPGKHQFVTTARQEFLAGLSEDLYRLITPPVPA